MRNLGSSWTPDLTTSGTASLMALYVLSRHIVDTRSHDIGDTTSLMTSWTPLCKSGLELRSQQEPKS